MNGPGFNLKAARMDRGVTVTELAMVTGISRNTLNRVEAGQVPSAPVAKAIADWVGSPASELWPTAREAAA